jgi:hypothetical protein
MNRRGKPLARWPVPPSARSHARGVLAEKRVFDVCGAPGRPAWVLGARRASPEEDASGIDVVVESDVGPLWLQVKSSYFGKARFLAKAPRPGIGVVVIMPYDPEAAVRVKVYSELGRRRAAMLLTHRRSPRL